MTKTIRHPFYRQSAKMLAMIVGAIALTKVTMGAFAVVIVAIGIWGALTRKPAYALICFALLPFMTILNPYAFGLSSIIGICARIGMPIMTIAMVLAAVQRPGKSVIPIMPLMGYVLVSVVSSMVGYCPEISFLKLINFALFIIGIYVGTKNIDRNPKDIDLLRAFFFAFSAFIVVGSVALHFVDPFSAHATSVKYYIAHGSVEMAKDVLAQRIAETGEYGYLCGVVNHSQCLGPTAACVFGWLLCDMLFVERRAMFWHLVLLCLCPVVLYMTKSRTSLLALFVAVPMVASYCVPKFNVSFGLMRKIRSMAALLVCALLLGGMFVELSSGGMRKWILKYDAEDAEMNFENVTATRRGKIDEGLYDFAKNPLFGMGFQVSEGYANLDLNNRFLLSAPVEKSFLPVAILGEAGAVGAIMFVIFLAVFYSRAARKGYYVLIALFTTFLATNLAEATFFSPGGTGGPEWLISVVGAFVIDMAVASRSYNAALAGGYYAGVARYR